MSYQPQTPQIPQQQPPPQPQFFQVPETQKLTEKIKNWDPKIISLDINTNKNNEMKKKDMIAPKFHYNSEKCDLSHKPCTDLSFLQSLELCKNLNPTTPITRSKTDNNERKTNYQKFQSVDYKGPDRFKQLQQQIFAQKMQQQKAQQQQQPQQQSNQAYLQRLAAKKEEFMKEQKDCMVYLKKVCSEAIDTFCKESKLTCNQKEEVTNSLQQFIYQEICNILSFSNQNSRQRTNYYVPSQVVNTQLTSFPKYSQKMLHFEDVIYSKYWEKVFSVNKKQGIIQSDINIVSYTNTINNANSYSGSI